MGRETSEAASETAYIRHMHVLNACIKHGGLSLHMDGKYGVLCYFLKSALRFTFIYISLFFSHLSFQSCISLPLIVRDSIPHKTPQRLPVQLRRFCLGWLPIFFNRFLHILGGCTRNSWIVTCMTTSLKNKENENVKVFCDWQPTSLLNLKHAVQHILLCACADPKQAACSEPMLRKFTHTEHCTTTIERLRAIANYHPSPLSLVTTELLTPAFLPIVLLPIVVLDAFCNPSAPPTLNFVSFL